MDMISKLPLDIFRFLFSNFFDIYSIINSIKVCWNWYFLLTDDYLWKLLTERDWNINEKTILQEITDGEELYSWKEIYKYFYSMKFLILTSESSYLRDIKQHLIEAGMRSHQIDLINVRMMQWVYNNNVIPLKNTNDILDLNLLKKYKAVFYFGCSSAFPCPSIPSFNATTMGNLLADFADQGGGIVTAVFANCSTCSGVLKGRWKEEQYDPILTSVQAEKHQPTIQITKHPILDGVTHFIGGTSSYYCTGNIKPGAKIISEYEGSGIPFIVESTEHKIISLNFFPPSSKTRSDFWKSSKNSGGKIMANSLYYVTKMKIPSSSSKKETSTSKQNYYYPFIITNNHYFQINASH